MFSSVLSPLKGITSAFVAIIIIKGQHNYSNQTNTQGDQLEIWGMRHHYEIYETEKEITQIGDTRKQPTRNWKHKHRNLKTVFECYGMYALNCLNVIIRQTNTFFQNSLVKYILKVHKKYIVCTITMQPVRYVMLWIIVA